MCEKIKGYKVFNSDWTCRGFQYEVGKLFEEGIMGSGKGDVWVLQKCC